MVVVKLTLGGGPNGLDSELKGEIDLARSIKGPIHIFVSASYMDIFFLECFEGSLGWNDLDTLHFKRRKGTKIVLPDKAGISTEPNSKTCQKL